MRLERRLEVPFAVRLLVSAGAIAAGILAGGLVVALGGGDAFGIYGSMFGAAFGSWEGWQGTLDQATPLILTGLAVALPARMGLWNIGGEGQLTIGAISATGIGLFAPLPGMLLPLAMVAGAMAAGAAWAAVAALPRAWFGLNEIIVTLFLNYIAIALMQYLVNGPWGDKSAIGFAYSEAMPTNSALPVLTGQLNIGILLALAVAALLGWGINRTPAGFSVRLISAGPRLAAYLNLDVKRLMVGGFCLAGAIAGLAGAIELMGVTGRLEPGISSNYGYSGILVAFLAGESIAGVVAGAVVYGALIMGGLALQGNGVSFDISTIVQALIVLFLLTGHTAQRYRIVLHVQGTPAAKDVLLSPNTGNGA
jgi:simple sugar transport system permease protein